jgi:hypothetical protein
MSQEPKILPKLALKSMGAQPAKGSIKDGEAIRLAAIYGTVSHHECIQTTFGDSERFRGDFEGVNIATGEIYRSSSLFLPAIVEDMMIEALEAAGEGKKVEFALEIGAEYSEKGNTGYAYSVRPLRKLQESDALRTIREEVAGHLKALPAPAKKGK